jgi:type I restriction-modification system DNA methylase subunit
MSKSQYQLNKEIEAFVLNKATNTYTQEEVAYINQYKGYGGLWSFDPDLEPSRGLYEYYTPIPVVEKMIGLAYQYGYTGGAVLEPSCGVGRFLHYFSPEEKVTGIELDKVSATIAQVNFPTFNILHQSFNQLFVDRRGKRKAFKPTYQLVIGNPPYGEFTGRYTTEEKKATKVRNYVEYFILRGLHLLQSGGLLIYIIPSSFLDGGERSAKTSIQTISTLVDAYRLPKRIFGQTDIQTDIIVLQKQ